MSSVNFDMLVLNLRGRIGLRDGSIVARLLVHYPADLFLYVGKQRRIPSELSKNIQAHSIKPS